jgi:hypothetical protein
MIRFGICCGVGRYGAERKQWLWWRKKDWEEVKADNLSRTPKKKRSKQSRNKRRSEWSTVNFSGRSLVHCLENARWFSSVKGG